MDADKTLTPVALVAIEMAPRTTSLYPPSLAAAVAGREKYVLGAPFGLTNFGVNLTRLPPGCQSALRHAHTRQDEFIYVLEGEPVLVTDAGETPLQPGMCAGFRAGSGDAHHLINRSDSDVVYLEVGDRTPGDSVAYPDDDLQGQMDAGGKWVFTRKDGSAL